MVIDLVDPLGRKLIRKHNATLKPDVDPDLQVTAWGGLSLAEQLAQRIGLWKDAEEMLPQRVRKYGYSTVSVVASLVYGLLQGGRGFHAAEVLSDDEVAKRMLGLHDGVPEEATVYRAMCNLAGLSTRQEEATYHPDPVHPERRGTRIVGAPEPAQPLHQAALDQLLRRQAAQLLPGLPKSATHFHGFMIAFGDASQLEVEGRCFDAAEVDYNHNRSLQWMTLWLGPLLVASHVQGGARHQSSVLRPLLQPVHDEVICATHTPATSVLALLDSAFGNNNVLQELEQVHWRYVSGLPAWRNLPSRAELLPCQQWVKTGPNRELNWIDSGYASFSHQAESWEHPRTVVAMRWLEDGKMYYEFRFLVTNLTPAEAAPMMQEWDCSYEEVIWRLYRHKQAREVQFKTPLSDLGLHHPPSGRLGCNQVFYVLAALAVNLAAALSHVGFGKEHSGMRLWRMRMVFFAVAARVQRHARQVKIWITGALPEAMQRAFTGAFARIAAVY